MGYYSWWLQRQRPVAWEVNMAYPLYTPDLLAAWQASRQKERQNNSSFIKQKMIADAMAEEQLKAAQLANKQAELSMQPDIYTTQSPITKGTELGISKEFLYNAPGYMSGVPTSQIFSEKAATDRAMIGTMAQAATAASTAQRHGGGGGGSGKPEPSPEEPISAYQGGYLRDRGLANQQISDLLAQQQLSPIQQSKPINQEKLVKDVMSGQRIQSPTEGAVVTQSDAANLANEEQWNNTQDAYLKTGDKGLLKGQSQNVINNLEKQRNAKVAADKFAINQIKQTQQQQKQQEQSKKSFVNKLYNNPLYKDNTKFQSAAIEELNGALNEANKRGIPLDPNAYMNWILKKYGG